MTLTSPHLQPPLPPQPLTKSLLDRVGAALLLALAVPWLLFIALTLWLIDDRPVLRRERRLGRDGRPFTLFRFDASPPPRAGAVRGRIRPLLQRSHLDELPQLLNVVRGDLSLVGPRPRPWDGGAPVAGGIKPGLIGLVPPDVRVRPDDELTVDRYMREWSLRLDLTILCRALRHSLRRPDSR